jgi:hypothetical protein
MKSKGKDWLVYDPIFGVIPKETKDLWEREETKRNDEYSRMVYLHKRRNLPPIRGSGHEEENHATSMSSPHEEITTDSGIDEGPITLS